MPVTVASFPERGLQRADDGSDDRGGSAQGVARCSGDRRGRGATAQSAGPCFGRPGAAAQATRILERITPSGVAGQARIDLAADLLADMPKALCPTPGSADICLIVDDDIATVIAELAGAGITIEEGPVDRTGATGPIVSCYLRDPDQNLIELSNYAP